MASPVLRAQSIWFVNADATGSNSGLTWQDAFTDLHDALAAAKSGDEIWIAQGTYAPDRGTKDRNRFFQLVSGVSLYGGFAGFETNRQQRDGTKNETILSGDLAGNDGPQNCWEHSNCCIGRSGEPGCDNSACQERVCALGGFYTHCCTTVLGWDSICADTAANVCCELGDWNSCENSYLIARGDDFPEGTMLDGLTISGSYPYAGAEVAGQGAGLMLSNSWLRLTNCAFRANFRGIVGNQMTIFLDDSSFLNNAHSPILVGSPNDRVEMRRCLFENNGYSTNTSWTYAEDCVFAKNRVGNAIEVGPDSVLHNCMFLNNRGGGLVARGEGIVVRDCLFADHETYYGMFLSAASAYVVNSVFTGQRGTPRYEGGSAAIGGVLSSLTLHNCLVAGNRGRQDAGINLSISSLRTYNTTITDNYSVFGNSSGIRVSEGSARIENSILWGNRGPIDRGQEDQIRLFQGATATVNNSIVEDWNGSLPGVNTLDADPLFVPGPGGDYYLRHPVSPAIDGGNDAQTTPSIFIVTTRDDEIPDASPVDLGFHYPITGRSLILGDADRNGEVNLRDVAGFQRCFDPYAPDDATPNCRIFDFNADVNINQSDLIPFLHAFGR